MTKEEKIIDLLKELLLSEYNTLMEADNRERNDGDDLPKLTDVFIETGSGRLPYARITLHSGEYTEKDRILRNTVYTVGIRLVTAESKESWRSMARYRELLDALIEAHRRDACWESVRMSGFRGDEVVVRVTG